MAQTVGDAPPVECVGPDYRPENEKPTATISTEVQYDNVHILSPTPQLIALLTYDQRSPTITFSMGSKCLCTAV